MPAITTAIALGSLAIGAAGLGLEVAGQHKQVQAATQGAEETTAAQTSIIGDEQAVAAQQNQLTQLDAKRKQVQLLRSAQQARAMSVASANSDGAGFSGGVGPSSGLSGSLTSIRSQTDTQSVGISQNLGISNNIFADYSKESQDKIALAQAQGKAAIGSAQGAGTAAIGSALLGGAGLIGKIASVNNPFGSTSNNGVALSSGGYGNLAPQGVA